MRLRQRWAQLWQGSGQLWRVGMERARTISQVRPGSLRLFVCAAGLWAAALIGLGPWALLATPALALVGFVCLRRHHHLGVVLIMFACLLTIQITALGCARGPAEDTDVTGTVIGHSQPGASGWSRLTLLTQTGIAEVLSPSVPADGSRVLMRTERRDDIRISSEDPQVLREPNGVWQWRAELRSRLSEDSRAVGHEGGDLLPGLVIGDTDPQGERMQDDMRVVSLTHISAVSGSNVTIVSLGAGLLAGACRAGPRTRVTVGVLTCAGYVFIVGFEPSAIRAAGMAIAVALVFLRGGGIAPAAVMCSTVCLLLAFVPVLATSVGFVLSVVSTAAIMFIVPIILRRLSVHFSFLPSVLATAVVVPLIAQLACTPVLVAIDPRIGAWSVAANALAAPAVLPATVLGFVSMVCAGLGLLGIPLLLWCAQAPAWLAALPAWWIVEVARICASLPGAALDWPEPPWGTLIALGLLLILSVGTWLLVRRRLWGLPILVLCIALTATVIVTGRTKAPAADWLVLVCDVGQGSGTLINLGAGRGLVVDTGKEPGPIDACLDDSGIKTFDLVISHFDADHYAGYAGTTWSRTLGRLWVSANVAAAPETRQIVTDTGAEAVATYRGETITAGAASIEVLWPPLRAGPGRQQPTAVTDAGTAQVPDAGTDTSPDTVPEVGATGTPGDDAGTPGDDAGTSGDDAGTSGDDAGTEVRNEDSLVLRVEADGVSYLIPGDVGEEEQYIIAQSLEPVDVLIAPHHGSADLSEDFFAAAAARMGVISVGENSYGHPNPRAITAFGPVPVLRTDRCGSIAIYAEARYSTGRNCPENRQ